MLAVALLSRLGPAAANYFDLTNNIHSDTESYVTIAQQLAAGEEADFGFRTPGYPVFVALMGLDLKLVLLAQALLGFATCVLIYIGVRSQCGELAARLSLAFLGLDVECQQVVHRKHESGEGRTIAESGVRAMPVVVVQPG